MNQHVKVTFDFTNYNYGTYDLAVPAYLPIKNLIALVLDSWTFQYLMSIHKLK